MKTKNLLRKIVPLAMLLALMIIVVMSCKKKDDTPPTPTPLTPPVPAQSDVFQNKPIKMMSDYEIANNLDFPGHVINQLGNGIAGGEDPEIPNPFKKIGKTMWEIYDYKHTEMRFDEIDKGINEIESQITQLQNDLENLASQLTLTLVDLQSFMTNQTMSMYVTDIKNAMDSTLPHTGFGWFTSAARKYQAGGTEAQFKLDTVGLGTLAYNISNRAANYDVITYYTQMNALICPPSGGIQTNALKTYANYIINHATGYTDSASMMSCYQVFENYFLQIINYQFQCAMMYTNAQNYYDSTGYNANVFYTGTFTTDIKQEVAAYLSTVEYLAVNLSDYRHFDKWEADYPYNQSGLAPDFLFTHVLARSQFIANLIYDALGLSYPVMCGTIITPNQYSNEYGSVVDSIALSANGKQLTSTANVLSSQFPYTYWNISNSTCAPDNSWNVYRFGKMGVGDPNWPTTAVTVAVVDNGNAYYPWSHYQPCQGNVTPLFYNPQNPSQTSTSYSSTCTMQFGYFAARWNWGYQFITMRNNYYLRPTSFDYMHENSTLACDYNKQFNPPGAATTSSPYGMVTQTSNSQGFFWMHANLGGCSYSGTCVDCDHYYFIADVLYCDIATSNDVPPISGKLEMWGMSNTQYNGQNGLMTVYLGTNLTTTSNSCGYSTSRSSGDIVKSQFGTSGVWGTSVSSVSISQGKAYQPSMEVYYQAYNPFAVPIAFSNYNMMQVVYDGTYNIFQ